MVCHKHVSRLNTVDVNALRNQRQSISDASTRDVFCSSRVDFGRIQAAAQLGIDWKSNYDQLCSSLDLQFGSATGSIHDYISNSVRCSAGHLACGLEVAPQYQETNTKDKGTSGAPRAPEAPLSNVRAVLCKSCLGNKEH